MSKPNVRMATDGRVPMQEFLDSMVGTFPKDGPDSFRSAQLKHKYPVRAFGGTEAIVGEHHIVTIEPRPAYCDRGHWIAKIFPNPDGDPQVFSIDESDQWPHYMDYRRALDEIRDWIEWRENPNG